MRKSILTALICLALLPAAAAAQSKAETNMYGRTVKKPTLKAAERFLKKYPESVYAPKIMPCGTPSSSSPSITTMRRACAIIMTPTRTLPSPTWP